jgi:hypothetical protein
MIADARTRSAPAQVAPFTIQRTAVWSTWPGPQAGARVSHRGKRAAVPGTAGWDARARLVPVMPGAPLNWVFMAQYP